MPMELYLYNYESSDNINNIISWKPEEKQWWITGFNSDYVNNVDVSKQVMVGKIDFTGREEMYEAFVSKFKADSELSKYINFNNEHHTIWIIWG